MGPYTNRRSAKLLLEWCRERYGTSRFADFNDLRIRLSSKLEFLGEYCPDENEIVLNPTKHRSLVDWCCTFIHEYIHFKQDMEQYELIKIDYDNHPYEIECNSIADSDKFAAKLWVLRKLRQRK